MDILNFDYDVEQGFAWIEVPAGNTEESWTVQCCLDTNGKGEPIIVMHDCGNDEGQCADSNALAFKFWGQNRCMKALFGKAKEAGIAVYE